MAIPVPIMIAAAPSGVQDMFAMLDGMDEVHVDDLFTLARELVRVHGLGGNDEDSAEDAEYEVEAQLEEYFLDKDVSIDSGCSEDGEQIYRTSED